MRKNLNIQLAKNIAIQYVIKNYDPLNKNNYFNFYYVCIGEDITHQPKSIFAKSLPNELTISNDSHAREIFHNLYKSGSEVLLKVIVVQETSNLKVVVLTNFAD